MRLSALDLDFSDHLPSNRTFNSRISNWNIRTNNMDNSVSDSLVQSCNTNPEYRPRFQMMFNFDMTKKQKYNIVFIFFLKPYIFCDFKAWWLARQLLRLICQLLSRIYFYKLCPFSAENVTSVEVKKWINQAIKRSKTNTDCEEDSFCIMARYPSLRQSIVNNKWSR